MKPDEPRHPAPTATRTTDDIPVLLQRLTASIDEQQVKDRLLADLHARFLPLHDGTLRFSILHPVWEDLILLHDRIVRQHKQLVDFPKQSRTVGDAQRLFRDMVPFFESIRVELVETLRRSGLNPIDHGPAYDPKTMHVVERRSPAPSGTAGKWVVVRETRKGFAYGERVVRRADVAIEWQPARKRAARTSPSNNVQKERTKE